MDTLTKLGLLLLCATFSATASAEWLGDWLAKNEPLVIDYVLSLKPSETPISGVTLTDGETRLKDFHYKNQVEKNRPGSNIHLFEKDSRYLAIIWLSSEAKPLPIPECEPNSEESKFPWLRASLISGDVYAHHEVQPGHGIVINYCPSDQWMGAINK